MIEKTVAAAAALSYPRTESAYSYATRQRSKSSKLRRIWCALGTRQDIGMRSGQSEQLPPNGIQCGVFFDTGCGTSSCVLFFGGAARWGTFYNPNVAFVQARRYSIRLILPAQSETQERIPNEQDYFMRELLPRRAAFNATLFVGFQTACSAAALWTKSALFQLRASRGYRDKSAPGCEGYSGVRWMKCWP